MGLGSPVYPNQGLMYKTHDSEQNKIRYKRVNLQKYYYNSSKNISLEQMKISKKRNEGQPSSILK